jgi:hypothetical protein
VEIPFTSAQFLAVFGRYNEAVWPSQIILNILALIAIALLYYKRPITDRGIAAILSFFWSWMALTYHFMFFSKINPAAWLFGTVFLIAGIWFLWLGVIKGELHFRFTRGLRGLSGTLLLIYSLIVYPILGYMLDHHYPDIPTFGLPCPTTIFTLGLLLFLAPPVHRSNFIVPLLWTVVGSIAAFRLGLLQDFGLLIAGVMGLTGVILNPGRHSNGSAPVEPDYRN